MIIFLCMEKEVGGKKQMIDHTELFRGSTWYYFTTVSQKATEANFHGENYKHLKIQTLP